ncbi:MAG: glycosyltransferase [Nitrospirae bacterium]|nr:glycosyltransferase [Nitrospirota bacterium]
MGEFPLISVIIPAYNHEKYVEETIRSIWGQDYPNIEIIVVDDASTDKTPEILARLSDISPIPMKVSFNEKNLGVSKTVNKAFRLSTGALIAPFSSDNVFLPGRFDSQARLFIDDPDMVIVYGNGYSFCDGEIISELFDENKKLLISRPAAQILEYLYTNTDGFHTVGALIRREFIEGIGAWDEDLLGDDLVINLKAFQRINNSGGHFAYVDKPLVKYRLHKANLHNDYRQMRRLRFGYINKFTPPHLKTKAYANACFDLFLSLAEDRHWTLAVYYFIKSQLTAFDPAKIRFAMYRTGYMLKRVIKK